MRPTAMKKTSLSTLMATATVAIALLTTLAAQQPPASPARPVFRDGQAQIVPAFQDSAQWIRVGPSTR